MSAPAWPVVLTADVIWPDLISPAALPDPSLTVLALALALDTFVGELPNALHPVVGIGRVITFFERRAPERGVWPPLLFGAAMAVGIPAALALLTALVLRALPRDDLTGALISYGVAAVLLKCMFAARGLGRAALVVREHLVEERLAAARFSLRSLCSRNPEALDAPLVAAAAIESLAENTADSVVAPLLYYALFGLPGAVFYRAVNTLDSMIGYHGKYEYLGKASARLDDLLNFVPARLCAGLLLLAGWASGQDARGGLQIWRRDAGRTESPNAGRPMATMAGLLGIQLEKVDHYRLGDARQAVRPAHIDQAWRVVQLATAATAALAAAGVLAFHVS